MKKLEIIGEQKYFEKFVNRDDIEILHIDIKAVNPTALFQEAFIAVVYYKLLRE